MTRPYKKVIETSTWTPAVTQIGRAGYITIADAIAADIQSGRLAPGMRLPPNGHWLNGWASTSRR